MALNPNNSRELFSQLGVDEDRFHEQELKLVAHNISPTLKAPEKVRTYTLFDVNTLPEIPVQQGRSPVGAFVKRGPRPGTLKW
jgi:hypothetical protein